MDKKEEMLIRRRLTQLEISVARMIRIISANHQTVVDAQNSPFECAKCGKNIAAIDSCEVDDCEWGYEPPEVNE